jgi:small subunit ribosomal protein S1
MSDHSLSSSATDLAGPSPTPTPPAGAEPPSWRRAGAAVQREPMGTFDADGVYTPRRVVADDLGGQSFEEAIDGTIVAFEDGDLVTGTVVKVDRDEVLLDIGFKSEGVIPARELSIRHDVDPHEVVALGDEVEALVLQKEDKEGRLVLSKKRAQYERAWGQIEKIKAADGVVHGSVIEVVKGGLIVDIGLRGFLPASLVELRRVRDLQPYIGRVLDAKIIELDKNRNNVVLSRRDWLQETQREQRGEFLVNLRPGEIRKGVVSSVVNFGAFVDLGGMDGLVHVSELSWKHVDHPSSVVSVGDEITVQVLDVDLSKERISLSLKATQSDPWHEFASAHRIGELVYGRITKLVPFGAFVQVGDGIEGLVHISEMATHHVELPEQVVSPGEELWVKIIDIDLQRRRISLSIKQAAEGGEVAEEYKEAFGEHTYDEQGNYVGFAYGATEFTPETEAQAAWAEYVANGGTGEAPEGVLPATGPTGPTAPADATEPTEPTEIGPLDVTEIAAGEHEASVAGRVEEPPASS